MKKTIALLFIILSITLLSIPFNNKVTAQTAPTVALTPSQITVSQVNQVINVNITISNVQNLNVWEGRLNWDSAVLNLSNSPKEGNFLTQTGYNTVYVVSPAANGNSCLLSDIIISTDGMSGSGVLAQLQFQVISNSPTTSISLSSITLAGPPPKPVDIPPAITPTSDSATATLTFASGGAPAANAGPDQVVTQGSSVTFDASSSLSSGSNPTYIWSFTDGAPMILTGKTQTYTFSKPGIYSVTLSLSDSNGASNDTALITVNNSSPPVAVIKIEGLSQGQKATLGQSIIFNGSDSFEANNGTIVKYLWDMGDKASNVFSTTNSTLTFAYQSNIESDQIYNVSLTVFDVTGLNGTTTTPITVQKGTISASPSPASSSNPTSTQTSGPNPTDQGSTITITPLPIGVQASSLPPAVLAILILVTIAVLGGSTIWLRKRT